jgi:GNAT superfamily N-acetyltransferase
LALAAATRLVSQSTNDIEGAARRLVASAPAHGIDLSLIWATMDQRRRVRQACLAVPGAGRTAMLFVSEPEPAGDGLGALEERVAVLDAACAHLGKEPSKRVHIGQALPDPTEPWFVAALEAAAFTMVGHLSYLRRPAGPVPKARKKFEFAEGITLTRVSDLAKSKIDAMLVEAMDRSYLDTLDCPELCGLRETKDILASHKDTGKLDTSTWWLVCKEGQPHGCGLFSAVPDAASCELVYLGLSPEIRGKGLGKHLLTLGIEELRRKHASWPMTLAVDQRNEPALHLYRAFGFKSFGDRIAFVRPVHGLAR